MLTLYLVRKTFHQSIIFCYCHCDVLINRLKMPASCIPGSTSVLLAMMSLCPRVSSARNPGSPRYWYVLNRIKETLYNSVCLYGWNNAMCGLISYTTCGFLLSSHFINIVKICFATSYTDHGRCFASKLHMVTLIHYEINN